MTDHDRDPRVIRVVPIPPGIRIVAVVAAAARILRLPLDVVLGVLGGVRRPVIPHDALAETLDGDERIAAHLAIDEVVVPSAAIGDAIEVERLEGRDREHVAEPARVVHDEPVAVMSPRTVALAGSNPAVLVGRGGKENAQAAVGVDADDRDVGILIGAKMDADPVAPPELVVAGNPDRHVRRVGGVRRGGAGRRDADVCVERHRNARGDLQGSDDGSKQKGDDHGTIRVGVRRYEGMACAPSRYAPARWRATT